MGERYGIDAAFGDDKVTDVPATFFILYGNACNDKICLGKAAAF